MTEHEKRDLAAEIDANIGRNLRATRESKGVSQAELARLVTEVGVQGVHQTTIARIESGQRAMRAAEGVAIARVLQTNLEWLAESRETAMLRSISGELHEKSQAFDAAARSLLHARLTAAQHMDRRFPYGEGGEANMQDVLKQGIDPELYETVETRIVNASPEHRLINVLSGETHQPFAYSRRGKVEHKQRVEFILDEYRGREVGDDVEHQTEA